MLLVVNGVETKNLNIKCIQFAASIINTADVIRKILDLFQLLHA